MKSALGKATMMAAGAAMISAGLAAGPAQATTPSQSTPAATSSGVTPSGMKFYDDYWTLKSCKTVGQWGLDTGKWTVYTCQSSPWDWDLYYDN